MKKILIATAILLLSVTLIACKNGPQEKEPTILPIDGSVVPYLDGGWVNVWSDEFEGDSVDESKWNFEINASGGGNGEVQYYNKENADVSDGTLKIWAKKESQGGRSYTSSRITTKFKGVFKYGIFQARLKLPRVTGLWPAFWMMPSSSVYGGWPNSGEIDIMEYVGRNPGKVFSTLHTTKYNHLNGNGGIGFTYDMPTETDWHVYELQWLPGEMIIRIDGVQRAQFKYTPAFNQDVPYDDVWPFDQDFFMILNLAIGGNFGGNNIDDSKLPAAFEIDYVRVYQLDAPYVDIATPSSPTGIKAMSSLKNGIFWDATYDDTGIEYYEIFADGEHIGNSNLHQHTFKNMTVGKTYSITIRAVDMAGHASEFSEPFEFTFSA